MKLFTYTILISVFSMFMMPVSAQDNESAEVSFKTTEVAKGIYMLSGENGFTGGNLGLLVGDEAVVLIDDSMPQFLDKMQQSIKDVTERPIDYVLNTHLHGDHTGNNDAVSDAGAHIIAHENVRKRLIKKGVKKDDVMKPAPKNTLPVITFHEALHLYFNEQPMHIVHMSHAHTDGDSVIYFKKANVIHAGDVFFNGRFPFIDRDSGGSVDGYLAGQKRIYEMANDQTQIIPGHGPLASRADLKGAIEMLQSSRDKIQALIDQGMDVEAIIEQAPLADFHDQWNWGFITTEKMTRQLYKDLSKAE